MLYLFQDALNELAALRLVTSSRSYGHDNNCHLPFVQCLCNHLSDHRPKYIPYFREVAQDSRRIAKIENFGGLELFDMNKRGLLSPQNIQILFKKLIFGLCRADCLWSVPNGDSMSLPKCLQKLALSSFARLDSR